MRAITRFLLPALLLAAPAFAAPTLTVTVEGITHKQPVPERYALCKPTEDGKSTQGENYRPSISWSGAPAGTKSFALFVTDPDVPADFSKAGKEGKKVGKNDPRQLFFHYGLIDIAPTVTGIPGNTSENVPDEGRPTTNSLGKYMPDNRNYGGPCPPWNDQRLHHYHFTVYALDTDTLGLKIPPTAKDAYKAVQASGHIIAQGETVGTYTLNKALRK